MIFILTANSARRTSRSNHTEINEERLSRRNDLIASDVTLPDRDIEFLDDKPLEFRDKSDARGEGQVVSVQMLKKFIHSTKLLPYVCYDRIESSFSQLINDYLFQ